MKRRSGPAAALYLFLACATTQAQSLADYDYENLSFRGLGADVGFIWPSRVQSTTMYSLRLDLGYLGPGVRIAPVFSYWSSAFRPAEINRLAEQLNRLPALQDRNVTIDPAELGSIEWSSISAGLDAHLVWTTPLRIITYIGAGGGIYVMNGQGSVVQNTFVEDLLDSTTAGVAGMAGAEWQALRLLRLYGELRYNLVSDVRYPAVRLGGAFMLPPRSPPATQGSRVGGR